MIKFPLFLLILNKGVYMEKNQTSHYTQFSDRLCLWDHRNVEWSERFNFNQTGRYHMALNDICT